MASTILSKLYQTPQQKQNEQPTILQSNPSLDNGAMGGFGNLANQILSAANPQNEFNSLVNSNKDAKNAMDIIQKYGNGDPKTAFMNYAAEKGKQNLGMQILERLGLK